MNPDYQSEAEFFKALSHPTRLKILKLLLEGEKCACELEPKLTLDRSTITRHLHTLEEVGFLDSRKNGVRVDYRIKDERVLKILTTASRMMADLRKERANLQQEVRWS